MQYIKVRWKQDDPDFAIWLYSELDDNRWEFRRVEIFSDGRSQWVDASHETEKMILCPEPVPSMDVLAAGKEFEPTIITKDEFERVWREARKETLESQ